MADVKKPGAADTVSTIVNMATLTLQVSNWVTGSVSVSVGQ